METAKKMISHTVVVDQYTEVNLKIPEVMTAMELKGIMMKANKLFNISEVPISDPAAHVRKVGNNRLYPQEVDDYIMEQSKRGVKPVQLRDMLAEKFPVCKNMTVKKVSQKKFYLENR